VDVFQERATRPPSWTGAVAGGGGAFAAWAREKSLVHEVIAFIVGARTDGAVSS
jgi:hypothetical protein